MSCDVFFNVSITTTTRLYWELALKLDTDVVKPCGSSVQLEITREQCIIQPSLRL